MVPIFSCAQGLLDNRQSIVLSPYLKERKGLENVSDLSGGIYLLKKKSKTEIRCMSCWVKLLQLVAKGSTQIERKIPSAGFVVHMLC